MDDGLTPTQHRAIMAARRALAEALEQMVPPGEVFTLAVVAIVGAFADIIEASTGAAELVALVNQQLAGAGLEVRQLPRN